MAPEHQSAAQRLFGTISSALRAEISAETSDVRITGEARLPSAFATTDLAAASIAAAGAALASLVPHGAGARARRVSVDRRLASLWFQWSLRPQGWALPAAWDPIAGDYATSESRGFIRLHTNAPHHRAAALQVLGLEREADKARVASAVNRWCGEELEQAIVERGGCAAVMRSIEAWARHPQGAAVATEPLLAWTLHDEIAARPHREVGRWAPSGVSEPGPLRGLRVLDLTRVLAGPVATRFLAGFGADVLRIDPPAWDEPGVVPEVTLGKRCARLDFKSAEGLEQLKRLLRGADVLVHGYRGGALDRLGLDAETRRALRPGLIDVSLDAYGWSGPWRHRRGFDSLVQMSAGIADAGMRASDSSVPKPLPVQALDHATGYLIAAAVARALTMQHIERRGLGGIAARTSLARVAALLVTEPTPESLARDGFAPAAVEDWSSEIERTAWGPGSRLRPALDIPGLEPMRWDRGASALGSSDATW